MDLVRLALERASTASAAVEVVTDLHPGARSGRLRPRRLPAALLVVVPRGRPGRRVRHRDLGPHRGGRGGGRARAPSRTGRPSRPSTPSTAIPASRSRRSSIRAGGPRRRSSRPSRSPPRRSKRTCASHVGGNDGWTVCMHVEGVEATTAAMVAELPVAARPAPASPPAHHAPTRSCVGIGRQGDQDLRRIGGCGSRSGLTSGRCSPTACGPGSPRPATRWSSAVTGTRGPTWAGRWGRRWPAGRADRGVVCCWTGTGVSMAANKVAGVRAALCTDAETARGARRWNDANVLALGLRLTSRHRRRRGRRRLPHDRGRSVGARADRPALLDSGRCRST